MPDEFLTEEAILRDCDRMTRQDRFAFRCDPSCDCFTHCCRDVSIVLTPYDVLRLKNALGIDSSEFLEKYTIQPVAADQKFPIVLLRMQDETKACPFVTDRGCGVYAGRPWACRMYPLGMAEPDQPTEEQRAFHFLVREDLCHGHDQGPGCTVADWISNQGIEEYEMMGAGFKRLTLHKYWDHAAPLQPRQAEMFYMACYDLDRFRRFVLESRFLELFDVDEARVEALRTDDEELLDFAMDWLRFSLFGEKCMKINRSVWEARAKS
jgi:uncharacterized protein